MPGNCVAVECVRFAEQSVPLPYNNFTAQADGLVELESRGAEICSHCFKKHIVHFTASFRVETELLTQ